MNIKLLAQTEEVGHKNSTLEDHLTFVGKVGGVCYMPDTFETLASQESKKHLKRAMNCIKSGHHSIVGHVYKTFLLEGIPKICAMLLNSVNCYDTSEKSARYTVMKSDGEDYKLYEKWRERFEDMISETYPNLDKAKVKKLALENARYILSIFTPTTMVYTVNLRTLNYILDWCEKLKSYKDESPMYTKLYEEMAKIASELARLANIEHLEDTKHQQFKLLNPNESLAKSQNEYFGTCYTTTYECSLAIYAHLIRHRTVTHTAYFDGFPKNFYIPPIFEKYPEFMYDWYCDLKSVAYLVPQGTMVTVRETGTLENFILKCYERECGCAQVEIQRLTQNVHERYEHSCCLTEEEQALLKKYTKKVKCGYDDTTCKTPCNWGMKSKERLV